MYIGTRLQERMDLLHLSPQVLSDISFVELSVIQGILENKIPLEHIDTFDLELLCNALCCNTRVLTEGIPDFLSMALPGNDTPETLETMKNLNTLMQDMLFVNSILQETAQ